MNVVLFFISGDVAIKIKSLLKNNLERLLFDSMENCVIIKKSIYCQKFTKFVYKKIPKICLKYPKICQKITKFVKKFPKFVKKSQNLLKIRKLLKSQNLLKNHKFVKITKFGKKITNLFKNVQIC